MLDRNMQQKNGLKNSDPALKLPASFINCPPHYKQSINQASKTACFVIDGSVMSHRQVHLHVPDSRARY